MFNRVRNRVVGTTLAALTVILGPALAPGTAHAYVGGANCHLSHENGFPGFPGSYWSACDYTPVNAWHWVHLVCADGNAAYDTAGYHPTGYSRTYSGGVADNSCDPYGGLQSVHFHVDPA